MKIKVLLFANLVLAGLAIMLYLNRPRETAVAPVVPDQTPPPENEVVSNVPSPSVDETKSNNVPKPPKGT